MRLAYLFERFPAPTQTFCLREVEGLHEVGVSVPLFSIRRDADADMVSVPQHLQKVLHQLPDQDALRAVYDAAKQGHTIPQAALLTVRHWGTVPDKERVYEAIYLGLKFRQMGITHVHCHFAGLAARTCWWLFRLFGIRYSFTAHANDVFIQEDSPVTLEHLMQDANLVITVSEFTARWLRERYPAHCGRLRVVYNGLDIQAVAAKTAGIEKSEPPLILSVGRLIEKKGFDDLITACRLLRDQGLDFECGIVGSGPDEAALRAQITAAGLEDHVMLVGSLPQAEVINLLAHASVFALPCATEKSGGKDNLPTVIMEAMAAQLPVVSTRLAGVPEMVIEEKTGLLAEERQPAEIAALLKRLLSQPDLAQSMGKAGQALALERFDKSRTRAALLRAFRASGALGFSPAALLQRYVQPKPPRAGCFPMPDGSIRWEKEE